MTESTTTVLLNAIPSMKLYIEYTRCHTARRRETGCKQRSHEARIKTANCKPKDTQAKKHDTRHGSQEACCGCSRNIVELTTATQHSKRQYRQSKMSSVSVIHRCVLRSSLLPLVHPSVLPCKSHETPTVAKLEDRAEIQTRPCKVNSASFGCARERLTFCELSQAHGR